MARLHPTLDDIKAELARGGVQERPIVGGGEHVAGFCDHDSQYIVLHSKHPEVIDTLCHELIHRRWPRWGEARVQAETTYIMQHLTDADIADLHRAYHRCAHKVRRPVGI
jgi:hypothetical protein